MKKKQRIERIQQQERERELQRERERELQWERERALQRERERALQRERERALQRERERALQRERERELQRERERELQRERERALQRERERAQQQAARERIEQQQTREGIERELQQTRVSEETRRIIIEQARIILRLFTRRIEGDMRGKANEERIRIEQNRNEKRKRQEAEERRQMELREQKRLEDRKRIQRERGRKEIQQNEDKKEHKNALTLNEYQKSNDTWALKKSIQNKEKLEVQKSSNQYSIVNQQTVPKHLSNHREVDDKTHQCLFPISSRKSSSIDITKTEEKRPKSVETLLKEMTLSGQLLNESDIIQIKELISKVKEKINMSRLELYTTVNLQKLKRILSSENTALNDFDSLSECLYEICLGVKLKKKFWPRDTQILSLYKLIQSYRRGILLQVNTGEGKTCIVAMFAAYLALMGKKVDIISSSIILAERDAKEWSSFYALFKLNACSNLTKNDNQDRQKCYKYNVVYGTVGSFASDILREEFLLECVLSGRRNDAVIVDEVDCLLIDQSQSCTYLSHMVQGLHHLEPVLLMIWNEVSRIHCVESTDKKPFLLGKMECIHDFVASFLPIQSGDAPKPVFSSTLP